MKTKIFLMVLIILVSFTNCTTSNKVVVHKSYHQLSYEKPKYQRKDIIKYSQNQLSYEQHKKLFKHKKK